MKFPKILVSIFPTVIAILITAVFMLPLVWLLVSAFRPEEDIFRYLNPLTFEAILPRQLTLDNFVALFEQGFAWPFFNSVLVASVAVFFGLIVNSLAAFALSAIEFKGRNLVFLIVVFSFLVPFEAIAIPLSGTVRDLGLGDTYFSLILPGVANGFAIFLLRQFFLEVPKELSEAAKLDGANLFRIFWSVYLPLSKAPLIGSALMVFIFQWTSYLWPLLVGNSPQMKLAPIALAQFLGERNFDAGQMFAGALLLSLFPILILLPLQRFFARSFALSGID